MENKNPNAISSINFLWQEGFFETEHTLKEVDKGINEKWGHNFSSSDVSKALKSAPFLVIKGKRGSFRYIQKISPISKKNIRIEDQLFSVVLTSKLGKTFETDLRELHENFGKNGNCSAFLLRKILEKLIFIVFAKNGVEKKLEVNGQSGYLLGLEAMIDVCTREKIQGVPFLTPHTAKEIKGIKFLGDTSAHNPLTNVDIKTILPQMPYIITAYKELAEHL